MENNLKSKELTLEKLVKEIDSKGKSTYQKKYYMIYCLKLQPYILIIMKSEISEF